MNPDKEFDCLVAIWGFVADEYARTRDPKLLAELDEIEQHCNSLRPRVACHPGRTTGWLGQRSEVTPAGVYLRGRS